MSEAGTVNVSSLSEGEIVKVFGKKSDDTGSPEVQVALITKRIETIAKHLASFGKDNHSKIGMMALISKRKGLLSYLKRESGDRYKTLIGKLGLRK